MPTKFVFNSFEKPVTLYTHTHNNNNKRYIYFMCDHV